MHRDDVGGMDVNIYLYINKKIDEGKEKFLGFGGFSQFQVRYSMFGDPNPNKET